MFECFDLSKARIILDKKYTRVKLVAMLHRRKMIFGKNLKTF